MKRKIVWAVLVTAFCMVSTGSAIAFDFYGQRHTMSPGESHNYDAYAHDFANDNNAYVALTANIGVYTENNPGKDGKDHLAISLSSLVSTRKGIPFYAQQRDPYTWADYPSAPDVGISEDDQGIWLDIPHNFLMNYYGAIYDMVYICANGYIIPGSSEWSQEQFDYIGSCNPNPASIPSTSSPNSIIAAYWTDLNPGEGGEITYILDNINDQMYFPGWKLVITWKDVPDKSGNLNTFQIVITWDSTPPDDWYKFNFIYFSYKDVVGGTGVKVGVESQIGGLGKSLGPSFVQNGKTLVFYTSLQDVPFVKSLEIEFEKHSTCAAVDISETLTYAYNLKLVDPTDETVYQKLTKNSLEYMFGKIPGIGWIVEGFAFAHEQHQILVEEYSEPEVGITDSGFPTMDKAWVRSSFAEDETWGRKPFDSTLATSIDWIFEDGCYNPYLTARAILTYETRHVGVFEDVSYTDTDIQTEVFIMLDDDPPFGFSLVGPMEITDHSVLLAWTKSADAFFRAYEIHFKAGTDDNFALVPPGDPGSTFYVAVADPDVDRATVNGLPSETDYCFRMIASDFSGRYSPPTNGVCGKTLKSPGGGEGDDGGGKEGGGRGASPYVFAWNGTGFALDNSLLPKSEDLYRPEVKTPDYYVIQQDLVENGTKYDLRIMEFEGEISNLDQVYLRTIDHNSGYNVSVDGGGNIYTWVDPLKPVSSIDWRGNDTTSLLENSDDDLYYEGWDEYYLTVDFDKSAIGDYGLLVVRSDVKYDRDWIPIDMPPYLPSELGPILVRMLDPNMEWITIGSLFPRTYWSSDVFDLSPYLVQSHPDVIRLRFDWEAHHKIDFVGIDVSEQQPYDSFNHFPLSAIHSRFGDVLPNLTIEDDITARVEHNDIIDLTFSYVPPAFEVRDFAICTKGYYYFGVDDIDISASLEVTMDVWGGDDSRVGLFVLENSTYFNYRYATRNESTVWIGESYPPPSPIHEHFYGYGGREYALMLWYVSNGTQTTDVQVEIESENAYESHNFTFDPENGCTQTIFINITSIVNETVSVPINGTASAGVNAELEFTPRMVPPKNQTFTWSSIHWDFGDGHQITCYEDERVRHEYENPGIYQVTMDVTFQDGNTITRMRTIEIE
ncbi:MAG: PKD domain-containing protein [Methanomassiliicoccales archaeon]|nr:MAG: PKD domain-containing protein [Methanomassiliicoccales archaeon]